MGCRTPRSDAQGQGKQGAGILFVKKSEGTGEKEDKKGEE